MELRVNVDGLEKLSRAIEKMSEKIGKELIISMPSGGLIGHAVASLPSMQPIIASYDSLIRGEEEAAVRKMEGCIVVDDYTGLNIMKLNEHIMNIEAIKEDIARVQQNGRHKRHSIIKSSKGKHPSNYTPPKKKRKKR
ncbi:hypothetical protein LZZ85_11350 [Terrimonas sp. NA20]|uniref:Uncharacterized protein n=1 Tax=Terrimonas ginsenosidimutans TaxID=2908004 RepID=A0ABS9KRD5_9BACT|nr:hypothetical protein [Terrimonas ginsenosidimutans]MCG2614884.1 hypothetical protein [Terrimonas ginsenosidimutans]